MILEANADGGRYKFLFLLYGDDTHSPRAIDWIRKQSHPLVITSLTEFELRSAFRFATFRNLLPTRIAADYWQHFNEDCEAGRVTVYRANLARALSIATRLSVRYTAD
ncbi:MAG: hypothetical protein HOI66_02015 [Verrucomicrobia bacterium]|jgi:hypothetical protein|nr:hypothetical protein [Verrucomicrobiota bacterium]